MRGIITSESEILDRALKGDIDKKPLSSLRVLAKLHFIEGDSVEEVEQKLNDYMKKYYKNYIPSKWCDIIEQLVSSVEKLNSYELVDIDSVDIAVTEWNKIIELNNKQLEKLAFILLVYCKINNKKINNNNNRVYNNLTDILSEASLRVCDDNKLLFNKLKVIEYIDTSLVCDSTTIKVLYCDEGEVKFSIDNFKNVISYYDEYRNDKKYIECEECKIRIIQRIHNVKYCNKCSKKIDNKNRNQRKR